MSEKRFPAFNPSMAQKSIKKIAVWNKLGTSLKKRDFPGIIIKRIVTFYDNVFFKFYHFQDAIIRNQNFFPQTNLSPNPTNNFTFKPSPSAPTPREPPHSPNRPASRQRTHLLRNTHNTSNLARTHTQDARRVRRRRPTASLSALRPPRGAPPAYATPRRFAVAGALRRRRSIEGPGERGACARRFRVEGGEGRAYFCEGTRRGGVGWEGAAFMRVLKLNTQV